MAVGRSLSRSLSRSRKRSRGDARTTPLPLLSADKAYSHVSPGVCDACERSRDAREAWVALLLGQFPSHVANAERTRAHLNEDASYIEKYEPLPC